MLTELYAPEPFFLKRLNLKEWIVSASGALVLIVLLQAFLAGQFGSPTAHVNFADSRPLDVSPGEAISVPIAVLNENPYVPTTVKTIKAQLKRGTEIILLQSDISDLPSLAAAQRAQILVNGFAPEDRLAPDARDQNDPPEKYDFDVTLTVHTGTLRGDGTARPDSPRALMVWPVDLGWDTPKVKEKGADYRRLSVTLYPGRAFPNGAAGHVQITTALSDVISLAVVCPLRSMCQMDSPGLSEPDRHGEVTRQVGYHTPPLERLHKFQLEIRLEGSRIPPDRWETLLKHLVFSAG
jgi:hypothetical protein